MIENINCCRNINLNNNDDDNDNDNNNNMIFWIKVKTCSKHCHTFQQLFWRVDCEL
jgi:hypothetical protein